MRTCKPHLWGLIKVSQARPLFPCFADKKHLADMGGRPTMPSLITPGTHGLYKRPVQGRKRLSF